MPPRRYVTGTRDDTIGSANQGSEDANKGRRLRWDACRKSETALPDATRREYPREPSVDCWKPLEGHHYTIGELAEEWNFSTDYITDLFEEEPDVQIFIEPTKRRPYRKIRVPWFVAERVYRRFTVCSGGVPIAGMGRPSGRYR